MSKQSSKELFEWYAEVAEQKLKEKYSHIETYKDCKDQTEFKNWILLIYIKYYGLRCTCDDCMDWEFHIASSHYHHCQLHKFCHAVNRCLEWTEHFHKPEVDSSQPLDVKQEGGKMTEKLKQQIRTALADYIDSEGCSCCQNIVKHKEAIARLGKLLEVPKYTDGSGFDFGKFKSQ